MSPLTLGPSDGSLTLHTGVAGAASRMGHRLVLTFDQWSVEIWSSAGRPTRAEVEISLDSLRVVSGSGGATPLSSLDKQLIKRNALKSLDAAAHPRSTLVARTITATQGRLAIDGDLTIAEHHRAIELSLDYEEGPDSVTVRGVVPVRQSDYGVHPYSLMMGALRVADDVEVAIELRAALPLPGQ